MLTLQERKIVEFGRDNNQNKEQIIAAIQRSRGVNVGITVGIQPTQQPQRGRFGGFATGVLESFKKRGEKVTDILGEREQDIGEQKFLKDVLQPGFQIAGQFAGGATDIIFEGLKAVTPEFVKKFATEKGRDFLETDTGKQALAALQTGVEEYNEFKQEHPDAAANLEAGLEIGGLLLFAGGKPILKGVTKKGKKLLITTARKLEVSAIIKVESKRQGFVRNLLRPEQTKKVKEAQVSRTTETGKGAFKKSIIEPTKAELAAEKEVLKIKGVTEGKTAQQTFNIISKENVTKAKTLKAEIKANDVLIPRQEINTALKNAKTSLIESPTIVGDAQKTADKLIAGAERIVAEHPGTASGLHNARIAYDKWVLTQKPKAFDAASENAFSIANDKIRGAMNDLLDSKLTNLATKELRREQSNLFNALKTIEIKAAIEADTAFLRTLQRVGNVLGVKSRIVQGIAAVVGIGGLGAAATFAPAVAVVGGFGLLTVAAGKLVVSAKGRKVFAELLKAIGQALPKVTDTAIKAQLLQDQKFITDLLKNQSLSE